MEEKFEDTKDAIRKINDHIISLSGETKAHKTCLAPPHFIKVSEPSMKSKWSCICVMSVSISPLSKILIFNFGIVPTV